MQLGLLVTARCNAACTHCATACGPDRRETLPQPALLKMMDEAARVADHEPLVYSISGGEPFLDFERLVELVAHGTALGGEVTCVTNGYWASSDEKARALVARLQAAGLGALGVSTSRFHQRFVRPERVKRALTAAIAAGIPTVLKYPWVRGERREVRAFVAWARAAGVREIESFPVLPYVREAGALPEESYVRRRGLPRGRCPIPSLTVREDGRAYSCCAPGGFADFLSVGNVLEQGVRNTYHRFLLQGRQRVLREQGPIRFAREARARGLGHLLRDSYSGACDLCGHIASDPRLAQVADEVAREYEQRELHPLLRQLLQGAREAAPSPSLPSTSLPREHDHA